MEIEVGLFTALLWQQSRLPQGCLPLAPYDFGVVAGPSFLQGPLTVRKRPSNILEGIAISGQGFTMSLQGFAVRFYALINYLDTYDGSSEVFSLARNHALKAVR